MTPLNIAIVDAIGLDYDGRTLTTHGIGGSESAIISMARELAKLGFAVTVFNDCMSDRAQPGQYDQVQYLPISALGDRDFNFDIVISQRTVIPFTPIELYDQIRQAPPRDYNPVWFRQLQKPSQLKIVWQQDTFLWGDHLLEQLTVNKHIDLIFNISDWHINYTTTCNHGHKRQFEVLKPHMWLTRNAINRWIDWVDIKQKDPNLFVYNASISKGMVPLVTKIWPRIKARLPQAKLIIIGGYYKFRDEPNSPAQQQWQQLYQSATADSSISFTGIIPQPQIAEIMARASYNLFPGAYPETHGISTLESINYNTPIIGTRFGAMAETGTELAGYYIDRAIEPNVLSPWIDSDQQINRYVDLVMQVVSTPYLHQQKQYACNAVKSVSTWDTVALQWKQLFYDRFGRSMDAHELDQVNEINTTVHQVFERRWANPVEITVKPFLDQIQQLPGQTATVAIVDIVGTCYDGRTLERRGLGGSESAVILVSRELVKLGLQVTVYNACNEDDCTPGMYDGVDYRPLTQLAQGMPTYDVVISSRCVTPFVTQPWRQEPQHTPRKIDYLAFDHMQKTAKHKVVWMHDTFCQGDHLLEDLTVSGAIDEIWTLTDFHTIYVANCSHPRMRNYEVLRNHLWTTRNGVVDHGIKIDPSRKNPDLFVFNANMSKGLGVLLNSVWPRIKQRIPQATLTVVGGHYRLGTAFGQNPEQSEFERLIEPHLHDNSIMFTGIVTQKQVAEIFATASFFIYPTEQPETYGISTVESLYQQTPLITCRFGGLEETATDHSYVIDYSLTPNSVYPDVNQDAQIQKFVNTAVAAHADRTQLAQRQQSLTAIRDIVSWADVALEWKHHLWAKLGLYLSPSETQRAVYTLLRYQQLFGRRLTAREQWLFDSGDIQQKIVVISPFRNAAAYLEKHINSVAAQLYENYEHWLIDDASTDHSAEVLTRTINQLPENIRHRFKTIQNDQSRGAVHNQIEAIRRQHPSTIVMLLDGDDWLVNQPDIFAYYNRLHRSYDFTYGSCWSVVDNIPLIAQPYPPEIKQGRDYRNYRFNWNIPYTHLRTLKAHLLQAASDSEFQDHQSQWYRAGGDVATFYAAIERCDPTRIVAVPRIVCNYNDASPLNDYKINSDQQNQTVKEIFNSPITITDQGYIKVIDNTQLSINQPVAEIAAVTDKVRKLLIAIPSNRNIEIETFKSIYDLDIPPGHDVEFQYFWGYSRAQVLNLICEWSKRFDYTLLIKPNTILSKDLLSISLKLDAELVTFEETCFLVKGQVCEKMINYPHFTSKADEKQELDEFINKVTRAGGKHVQLNEKIQVISKIIK